MRSAVASSFSCRISPACLVALLAALVAPRALGAQEHVHGAPDTTRAAPAADVRIVAGTVWQPAAAPMTGLHASLGEWRVMLHGNASAGYLRQATPRGGSGFGSTNWWMARASRPAGTGTVTFSAMGSLERWTLGSCGYPQLLSGGPTCSSRLIGDFQHAHPPVVELAARYDAAVVDGPGIQFYLALVGDPAFGIVPSMHRASAVADPIAPMTEHDLAPAHAAGGVATVAFVGERWKLEGSVFGDGQAVGGQVLPALRSPRSTAARLSWAPGPEWTLQASAGALVGGSGGHHAGQGRAQLVSLVAMHVRPVGGRGLWASTLAFGRASDELPSRASALLESSVSLGRHTLFARAELADRLELVEPGDTAGAPDDGSTDAHDAAVTAARARAGQLSAGYVVEARVRGLPLGVGARASLTFVPTELVGLYGDRHPRGFALFATMRPGASAVAPGAAAHAGH